MPRSNCPSATYRGISWGRRMRTSATRGSATVPRYSTSEERATVRSAASNSASVARSSEPLGRTSFSTCRLDVPVAGLGELTEEVDHLQGGGGRLEPLVAGLAPGPVESLLD